MQSKKLSPNIKELQENVIHYLKTYRLKKNFSQQDMADVLGIHRNVLSKYERIDCESRVFNALDLFLWLGNLEGLSLGEFVRRIDPVGSSADQPWLASVHTLFNVLLETHKKSLKHALKNHQPEAINEAFSLFVRFLQMDRETQKLTLDIFERFIK